MHVLQKYDDDDDDDDGGSFFFNEYLFVFGLVFLLEGFVCVFAWRKGYRVNFLAEKGD